MKFTIIVPVYNAEKTIEACLKSLLSQDYKSYEVIIVDDGSTDNTYDILKKYQDKAGEEKIRIIKQRNKGPAAARNNGIKHATGNIIAFTDADCIVPVNWLSSFKKIYDNYPYLAGIGGILEPSKHNWVANLERIKNRKLYGMNNKLIISGKDCPIGGTNNISYRKEVLDSVKGFDENFPKPAGEDFDLKLRICSKGYKLAFAPIKVIHNEPYDFDYLLRQFAKRGIPFRISNKHLFLKVLILLPIIVPTLIYKVIAYKIKSKA